MLKFATQFKETDQLNQRISVTDYGCSNLNGAIVLDESQDSLTPLSETYIVAPEIKKPELGGSGQMNENDGVLRPPIIAHSDLPANEKNIVCTGEPMAFLNNGYIRLPRSLLNHPGFTGAHVIHQRILLKIIELVGWNEREFNDQGHILKIEPGEVCISHRELANACGHGCTRHWIAGALGIFIALRLVGQRVGHKRMILKITHKDTYDLIISTTQTSSRAPVGQRSDIKEDHKELKKEDKKTKAKEKMAPRKVPVATEDGLRLCRVFSSSLSIRLPDVKIPTDPQKWAIEFDRLLKTQTIQRIEQILEYLPRCFYQPNVQCPRKFREKFVYLCGLHTESIKPKSFTDTKTRRHKASDGTPIRHELEDII